MLTLLLVFLLGVRMGSVTGVVLKSWAPPCLAPGLGLRIGTAGDAAPAPGGRVGLFGLKSRSRFGRDAGVGLSLIRVGSRFLC